MFEGLFKKKPKKQEPAVVENDLGRFEMEYLDKYNTRPAYAYLGTVRWNGRPNSADIEAQVFCDSRGSLSADKGFERLRALLADAARTDNRLKAFVLKENIDADDGKVHIWGSCIGADDEKLDLSPGEFVKRLTVDYVSVLEDGSVSFSVDVDEMFTDHGMEVVMEADSSFSSCCLVG